VLLGATTLVLSCCGDVQPINAKTVIPTGDHILVRIISVLEDYPPAYLVDIYPADKA
jgi:hypothetical protein